MIWQNPWAWTGLLLLAVPVLVHLLGRRSARVQPFPTLRFLGASRLQAVRRSRLTDLLLLAIRMSIVLAAVAALAQPLLLTGERERDFTRIVARAILVDTSASMGRPTLAGTPAADAARDAATREAAAAGTHVLLESASPAGVLAGAAAWLSQQPGRREIVIVSDFQAGTLEAADLASVPEETGVRFHAIEVASTLPINVLLARHDSSETVARIQPEAGATAVAWSVRPVGEATRTSAPALLAGVRERDAAGAALRAANAVGLAASPDSAHAVAIVFPEYEERETLLRTAGPLNRRWMAELVMRLRSDAMLQGAARSGETAVNGVPDAARWIVVAQAESGPALVLAASRNAAGREELLLLSQAAPASLVSAALIRAASRAGALPVSANEMEPSTIPTSLLAQWERPARPGSPGGGAGGSDGRWFWVLALALLGLETVMRRQARSASRGPLTAEERHERVA